MPRKKSSQSSPPRKAKAKPVMPFSLVLSQEEMVVLRREAKLQGTSVGGVVRGAIHASLLRTHPELVRKMVHREVESFVASLRAHDPGTKITPALRARIQRQILSALVKK
ncbi:MAG: hypothetical protein HZB43_01405 [candidate division Zixibacteria bacterium]|nr:hypothetical protein [candidate division Zixibacteria bacterium]